MTIIYPIQYSTIIIYL